jgi:hypothetical protein
MAILSDDDGDRFAHMNFLGPERPVEVPAVSVNAFQPGGDESRSSPETQRFDPCVAAGPNSGNPVQPEGSLASMLRMRAWA